MAITLNASAVPAPILPATYPTISDGYIGSPPGNTPTSRFLASGATNICSPFNENACRADVSAQLSGGGCFGILQGLVPSTNTGLVLHIPAGIARLWGAVQVAAYDLTCTSSIARLWVWLKSDGTFTTTNNAVTGLTPPADDCCLICSVVTSGSAVTAIDYSGVVYFKGGAAVRSTADAFAPTDTPPAVVIHTITAGGNFVWNGSAYAVLNKPSSQNRIPTQLSPLIVAPLALTASTPRRVRVTCASGQKVLAPPYGNVTADMEGWEIFNDNAGGGSNLTLRDSTDANTLATITPQSRAVITPLISGGFVVAFLVS